VRACVCVCVCVIYVCEVRRTSSRSWTFVTLCVCTIGLTMLNACIWLWTLYLTANCSTIYKSNNCDVFVYDGFVSLSLSLFPLSLSLSLSPSLTHIHTYTHTHQPQSREIFRNFSMFLLSRDNKCARLSAQTWNRISRS